MSSFKIWDTLKFIYKIISYKLEQRQLTTNEYVLATTKKGQVKGIKRKSVWNDIYISFEKIPFAKPPVNELRFKAPEPNDAWEGILDCTNFAEKPIQSNVLFSKTKGSEDCLYLNVYTKDLNPEKLRPVMVWVYGGGYQVGEASRDVYSPEYFMCKDIVFVAIAYRLGPFGFLSLKDPELNVPGNAGIKDQIMSFQWVKDNISSFGGDPNNITLFGESAGGASAHYMMLCEQTRGLFHKVIAMSGCVLCPWSNSPPNDWGYRLAKQLGYDGENIDKLVYNYLSECKASDIVIASPKIISNNEKHNRIYFAFGPVVEPYVTDQCVLSKPPYEAMQQTWSHQIPMLIGATSFEGLLFYPEISKRPATLLEVGNCKNLLPMDLNVPVDSPEIDEMALRLKETYFGNEECNVANKMKFLDLQSYREFVHPIYRTTINRQQHAEAPTYLYRFDFDSKTGNVIRNMMCGSDVRGTCHGDDLFYMFNSMISNRYDENAQETKITRLLIDIWTSFAEKSDPNCAMLNDVSFKPIDKEGNLKCLNISDNTEFIDWPDMHKINVWNSFYPQGKL